MERDPNQLFVVSTVSRADIAEALEVEPTDERLTDEYCQGYADRFYEYEAKTAGLPQSAADAAFFDFVTNELDVHFG